MCLTYALGVHLYIIAIIPNFASLYGILDHI